MRLAALLVIAVVITGCTNMDVYTFKKERVDQQMEGNRGYISGEAPAPEPRDTKRELIGVDIGLVGGKEEAAGTATEPKTEVTETVTKTTTVTDTGGKKTVKEAETVVVDMETSQEEWVK